MAASIRNGRLDLRKAIDVSSMHATCGNELVRQTPRGFILFNDIAAWVQSLHRWLKRFHSANIHGGGVFLVSSGAGIYYLALA
jgi:hypothetical protein